MPVGLDSDGWVAAPPPDDPNLAGWFTGAVSPGENGTAVVVGHVDNTKGPAVFYGLGALKKGNHVEVRRKDGKTAVFEIYGIEVFDKANFPGDRVYGSTGRPELRVITCGGGFTKRDGYSGNVVVFARLTGVR
jgi:sortase (surface protein transpeptidase)